MAIDKFLRLMVEKGASDMFITTGVAPSMKVNGKIMPLTKNALSPEQVREVVFGLMNSKQQDEFEEKKELNFAINASGIGRFRASAFYQPITVARCCGGLKTVFPAFVQWGWPMLFKKIP